MERRSLPVRNRSLHHCCRRSIGIRRWTASFGWHGATGPAIIDTSATSGAQRRNRIQEEIDAEGAFRRSGRAVSRQGLLLPGPRSRSEEHTSELQSLMRISYAVFCLKKTKQPNK